MMAKDVRYSVGLDSTVDALKRAWRNEALEDAARACERRRDETGPQEAYAVLDVESYTSACGGCAFDIRALKEKADE